MNIMLAGDSWGVPNWKDARGAPPEYHTQFLLDNLGHTVTNVSLNGNSNFYALELVQNWSHNVEKQDYLIWFHTSPFRDIEEHDFITRKSYYDIINAMLIDIRKNVKIIAIGGCGKLSQDLNFSLFDYYIGDWKAEIMDFDFLPEAYLWGAQLVERNLDVELIDPSWGDTETLLDEVTYYDKNIFEPPSLYSKWIQMFPDIAHPGLIPHRDLVNKLCAEVFDK